MKKFSKNVLAIQVSKVIKFSKAVSKYATKITISLVVQIVARIAQMYRATRGTVGKIVKKLRHSKGTLGSAVTNSKKQTSRVASKISSSLKNGMAKTRDAVATRLPKVIKLSKEISKYATEVTTLVSARIAQMYRATMGTAGKIVERLKRSKGTLKSAIATSKKQLSKVVKGATTLLATKIAQMYRATSTATGKIVERLKRSKGTLKSAVANSKKQLSKVASKISSSLKNGMAKTKDAVAAQLPKVIKLSKEISKYATEVITLVSARIAQMYRATRTATGKIVERLKRSKGTLGSAMATSKKQFPKIISQIAHLLKLTAVVSLHVTKVGIMRTIDWTCSMITKGDSMRQSCLTKSRNFVKSGSQKLVNFLKFFVSSSIFVSRSVCKGAWFICLSIKSGIFAIITSIKNAILKAYNSILATIRRAFQLVGKFVNAAVKTITYPFTASYAFLKRSANNFRATCVRCATAVQSSISSIRSSISDVRESLKAQFSSDNVFAVLQKPAVVLPLAFTIVAFIGLRVYDGQISKVEYTRAALSAKHEKDLLRQKRYVLHGYENETVVSKHKRTKQDRAFAKVPTNKQVGRTDLQKAVDSFFHNHRASEIMCDGNSCKMKIDGKIVDGKGPLTADSTIFISETDGDHIVFADASGNRYVKSIDSLFDQ